MVSFQKYVLAEALHVRSRDFRDQCSECILRSQVVRLSLLILLGFVRADFVNYQSRPGSRVRAGTAATARSGLSCCYNRQNGKDRTCQRLPLDPLVGHDDIRR